MKKFLFVIDTLQLGGSEQSLLANVARFKKTESIICHLYPGETLKPHFLDIGKKVYSFNIDRRYGFYKAYKELKKVVEAERPDLIIAYLTRSELVSRTVGKFSKTPVVGTFVNDLYTPSYNQHLSWTSKQVVQIFKHLNKFTSKICVGFVANSEAIKQANAKHLSIPADKIKVINRGRDSSKFQSRNMVPKNSDDTIRFVNVSRLFPVKGHKHMILGFASFIEKYPNATLDIIGDGPLKEDLGRLIEDNGLKGKISLLGARNDVPSILANYDCFVFPTIMEGFSGAIVEAMFAGLPVLATDIQQNQEAITHLETGYLFSPESSVEVEKAMLWYKENLQLANELSIHAYKFAKEHFELDNIVEQFETYLHKQIDNKN